MKVQLVVLLILGLGVSGPATAKPQKDVGHSSRETRASDADVHRILRLEDQWADALPRRDGAFFQKLLAKGFIYTENDHMMGREELLRELTRGSDRVTAAHNERMRVHTFGSTAVVTGWLDVRSEGPGGRQHRRYRFTDTWVRRNDEWQLVAAHDYVAPSASR